MECRTGRKLHHPARAARWLGSPSVMWFLVLCVPVHASAQVTLPYRPCNDCRIRIERLVTLPKSDLLDGLVGQPTAVAVDDQGRYYVTQFQDGTRILVFSREGAFVSSIGRAGSGPGEFRQVRSVAVRGDSVYGLDVGLQRLSIFTLNGEYVRSVPVPLMEGRRFLLRGRAAVIAGEMPSVDRAGLPLHEVDLAAGNLAQSFGDLSAAVRPFAPWLMVRAIAMDSAGRIWSARRNAYDLELWDTNNRRIEHWRRDLPWFQPWVDRRPPRSPEPPPPALMALSLVGNRYLVVAITRAPPNYKELLGPPQEIDGRLSYDYRRYRLLNETVLEVIDLDTRSVIARGLLDDYVTGVIPGTTIAHAYDEVEGVPQISMIRVHFETTRSSR